MNFLEWLSGLRTPLGDLLMGAVTRLGEEALFIVLALTVFWCVDKKRGYFLLFTGFVGMVCNQLLKMIFRIPRPWVRNPDFEIVESAREQATGYSFPSGHTQIAATLYGGIARTSRRRTVQVGGVLLRYEDGELKAITQLSQAPLDSLDSLSAMSGGKPSRYMKGVSSVTVAPM